MVFKHLSRLFKHSVFYGLSETISRGTGFVLVFIYIKALTQSELGIRTEFYAASAFLALFYTFGLDNAFLRYFMDEEFADKRDRILSSSLYFTILTGLIFYVAAFVAGDSISFVIAENSSYVYITHLLFVILILDTVVIYPTLILRAENRFRYYFLISISRFVLFIVLNILFIVFFGRGVNGVFEANLIVVLIVFFMLLPVYRKYFSGKLSFAILKRMLYLGVPTIFTLLAIRIIDLADRRIILYFFDELHVAQYAVPYTLGMAGIMVFVNSFRIAWQPFYLSIGTNPEAKDIFSKTATYYALLISVMFLAIVLFRDEIFILYTILNRGEYPVSLANIIPFVSISYVIYGFYFIMLAGIFLKEKTIVLPIATCIGAAVNVGLNFLFIPRFGIIGAAYTTIIAYTIMVMLLYFLSRNIYHIKYEFKRLAAVFLITAIPIILSLAYEPAGIFAGLLFKSLLFLVPFAVFYFTGFLSEEEKKYIKQKIRSII
ncbi:polysaccharide biosynthesis C-terminal domain-containing protein [Candidatus Latescibacterota bacterium]